MNTYLDKLADPVFVAKLESKLTGYIVEQYLKAGKQPPLPKLRDHVFHYDDPKVEQAADRIRTGFQLMALVLDEMQLAETKGDQANE